MKQEQLLERSFKAGDVTHNLKVISGGAEPESSAWWAAQYIYLVSRNLTAERFIDLWASFIRNDSEIKNWTITDYINSLNSTQINEQFEVEYNGEKKTTNLFSLAIENNQIDIVNTLIEKFGVKASLKDLEKTITLPLNNGALMYKNLLNLTSTAMPMLIMLAKHNKWDLVSDTLEQPTTTIKESIDQMNQGKTLLHLASGAGKEEVVNKLNDLGANCGIADKYGMTPLHLAIASGKQETAERLFTKYPQASEHKDKYGRTPMEYANHKIRASSFADNVLQSTSSQQVRSM
ncbi:hypothetical protein I862_02490 [endosymbiont of Acanthamoeba sp. UWC8]|uniref:ankyrin repeat domain-containing protein n=1 Tax=endosymbiont of Acanthamoeba sp. UWC8 TaxID=86106 RepID=UPI0004D14171|nr:ankyrin repeat domain-containing protein [endosymbiont of Acanthamoeba sp. UWC8]AIF81061.1 hypothetical protein I862_02490 [endosymbiont of Acanthamoeba sp. UWC8]